MSEVKPPEAIDPYLIYNNNTEAGNQMEVIDQDVNPRYRSIPQSAVDRSRLKQS